MLNIAYCSDKYQYTMGKSFYDCGKKDEVAIFNMFYRKAPENNNWAVVSGTDEVIEMIENLGNMDSSFFEKFLPGEEYAEFRGYLSAMKFTGNVYAMREGEIAFPSEPIIIVEAPLIEAQVLETPMLCIMNHQMAVATKASRVCRATDRPVSEFGSRRAHGPWAATYGAKAAIIAGCSNTSNILTGVMFDYGSTGTMAHSYVTSFGCSVNGEFEAFDTYIKTHKGEPLILLIDTYDTLKCGILNAMRAYRENGIDDSYSNVYGIRLDSGDLAYLSKKARKELDQAGLPDCKIIVSNSLDEYTITSILDQGGCIDSFGVGERLITSKSEPVFGAVYKIVAVEENGIFMPRIKISENTEKITNPGLKNVYRIYDHEGHAIADLLAKADQELNFNNPLRYVDPIKPWKNRFFENCTAKKLQIPIFIKGQLVYQQPSIDEIAAYVKKQLSDEIWEEEQRFENPHNHYMDMTPELYEEKMNLLYKAKM